MTEFGQVEPALDMQVPSHMEIIRYSELVNIGHRPQSASHDRGISFISTQGIET